MRIQTMRLKVLGLALILATFGAAGCTTTAHSIDSGKDLARASTGADSAVVFGKFVMIRNGEAVRLGDGLFANRATLHFSKDGEGQMTSGVVGRDGEFAWALEPGSYVLSNIGFTNRGEKFETDTAFTFTVASGSDAVYVGTITLASTFESGYYGLNGTVDSFSVENDCATDCDDRLAQLGLETDSSVIALLSQEGRLAQLK